MAAAARCSIWQARTYSADYGGRVLVEVPQAPKQTFHQWYYKPRGAGHEQP